MNRRDVLRLMGGATVAPLLLPLSAQQRLALGADLHARAGIRERTLDPDQGAMIARVAELIIPETDTPGATTVHVGAFIDLLLTEWYDPAERDHFVAGLAAIDDRSRSTMSAAFMDLSESNQIVVLETLDGQRGDLDTAEGAFRRIKELTVYGYFTSQLVVENVLHTPIIPGRFEGCAHV